MEIRWGESVSEAISSARTENKLVFIDFYRTDCDACMKMEKETYVDHKLSEYINRYFISLKFKSGRDSEQFYRYDVNAEPAFIVLDAEGDEVYRKIGYFDTDSLIRQLERARKKAAHRAARKK